MLFIQTGNTVWVDPLPYIAYDPNFLPRHSRHFLSGIQAVFPLDGYPPQTAGMTAKRWMPATDTQV